MDRGGGGAFDHRMERVLRVGGRKRGVGGGRKKTWNPAGGICHGLSGRFRMTAVGGGRGETPVFSKRALRGLGEKDHELCISMTAVGGGRGESIASLEGVLRGLGTNRMIWANR